jgi:ATP diphosphatase
VTGAAPPPGPPRAAADPLAGIPETLPALLYARKLQRRAAGGSDRVEPGEALAALRESLKRTEEAVRDEARDRAAQEMTEHGSARLYERVGDLLFATVEVARSAGVDPELALRRFADSFRAARS